MKLNINEFNSRVEFLTAFITLIAEYNAVSATILPDNIKISFLKRAILRQKDLAQYVNMWKQSRKQSGITSAPSYAEYYKFICSSCVLDDAAKPLPKKERRSFTANLLQDGSSNDEDNFSQVDESTDDLQVFASILADADIDLPETAIQQYQALVA